MKVIFFRKYAFLAFLWLTLFLSGAQVSAQCPTVADNTQSFCDLQTPLISNLVATNNGGGVAWFASPTSTTPLSASAGLVNGQTYYADNSAGNCGTRVGVTVTIYSAPTRNSVFGDCYPADGIAVLADIDDVVGNNIQWYTQPSGGTPLPLSTVLINNAIYYASQTNPDTGCETSRLAIFINNIFVPVPSGPPVQYFCNTPGDVPTISDLNASGANNWYQTASSAVVLNPSTPLVNGQSYFATTVNPPCESIERLEVTAFLVEPHDAGTSSTLAICQSDVGAVYDLFSELGGSPETTGTWSGPIPTENGHLGTIETSGFTVAGSPYVFTYTVSSPICAASTSTVTINILPLPVVSVAADNTICSGESSTVTFTGTPNASVSYTVNGVPQVIVLNSNGTAVLNNTYTVDTVIELAAVTTTDPNSCTQTQTGSITITVLPLPVATLSDDITICTGASATVTFTGTPNATITYTVNNQPAQTIVLNAAGSASITANYNSTTIISLLSAATNAVPPCSQPQNDTITITVVPVPTATISGNSTNVCPGGNATVTFTGTPNATITYTVNGGAPQTILLNNAGIATLTNTYNVTTTYTLTGITTSGAAVCSAPATGSITITVLPVPQVTVAANTTVCSGGTATVTFTGTPNTTVTYSVNGGAPQTIVLDSAGIATISSVYTQTTIYTLIGVASAGTPSCSQPQSESITITVVPLPTAAISGNTTICAGQDAAVNFTGTPNATVTYTINGGAAQTIILDNTGNAVLNGNYSDTTTIALVSASTAGTPTCIQLLSGSVTITVIQPATVTVSGNATICPGGSAPVTFTGTPNATVTYIVNNGPEQTIVLNGLGVATTNEAYNETTIITITEVTAPGPVLCSQPAIGSVTISVLPLPTVTITSDVTICAGGSATITFTGTPNATITYTVNGGGNQTILLDGSGTASITATYTVTTIVALVSAASAGTPSCSQPQSGSVTITVIPLPTVSIASSSIVCSGESATVTFNGTPNATIVYTVNGVTESIQLDGSGLAVITSTYTATTIYQLVSATMNSAPGCSQPQSGSITVTVAPVPTVSISGSTILCAGESATITFTGTPNSTVTYTVNGGPNQMITLDASGNATITTTYSATTVYELVDISLVGSTSCTAPASGNATITIVPPPVVTISAITPICTNGTSTIIFTGTPNAIITYTSGGQNQTIVLDATGSATIVATLSQTTTYTLISAALAGNSSCSQPQTGSVTINIVPLPVVNVSASTTICSGSSATVTFTGTPNATVVYNINGGPNQNIILSGTGTATITNNYTSTTTYNLISIISGEIAGCSQLQNGNVTITVVAPPVVTISAASSTICSGQNGTVTFTGTPGAMVTYSVNGGPNQNITLSNVGTATISGTLTATTTYSLISATTSGDPACAQNQTGSVTLTVTPIPVAGDNVTNHAVCANSGLQDLFLLLGPSAQPGGTWFPVLSNGNGIFDPEVDPAGTYIYTVSGTAPCPDDSAAVTISIIQPPTAGSDASVSICSNEDPRDLFTLLGVSAQTGGTWSPALASGTGIFDPAVDVTGIYTYTIAGSSPCGPDSAVVNVTVVPGPTQDRMAH